MFLSKWEKIRGGKKDKKEWLWGWFYFGSKKKLIVFIYLFTKNYETIYLCRTFH